MRSYYETSERFRRYVDGECKKNKCSVDTCLTFSWVKAAYEYYKDDEKRNATRISSTADAEMGECK